MAVTDVVSDKNTPLIRHVRLYGEDPDANNLRSVAVDGSGFLQTTANVSLNASDIQIGAVELKNGDTDQRATVHTDGSLYTTDVVLDTCISGGVVSVSLSNQLIDNCIAAEDAVAPTGVLQVGGKYESTLSEMDDGDLAAVAIDAFRRMMISGYSSVLDALKIVDQAPVLYDREASTARTNAALAAAGAYDTPTEISTSNKRKLTLWVSYDEDAGGTNGAVTIKLEKAITISGSDTWGRQGAIADGTFAGGADTASYIQAETFEFDPTTAGSEVIIVEFDVVCHKFRVSAKESGDTANPGTCQILYMLSN